MINLLNLYVSKKLVDHPNKNAVILIKFLPVAWLSPPQVVNVNVFHDDKKNQHTDDISIPVMRSYFTNVTLHLISHDVVSNDARQI